MKKLLGCLGIGCLLLGGLAVTVVVVLLARDAGLVKPVETAVTSGPSPILSMDFDREAGLLYFIQQTSSTTGGTQSTGCAGRSALLHP